MLAPMRCFAWGWISKSAVTLFCHISCVSPHEKVAHWGGTTAVSWSGTFGCGMYSCWKCSSWILERHNCGWDNVRAEQARTGTVHVPPTQGRWATAFVCTETRAWIATRKTRLRETTFSPNAPAFGPWETKRCVHAAATASATTTTGAGAEATAKSNCHTWVNEATSWEAVKIRSPNKTHRNTPSVCWRIDSSPCFQSSLPLFHGWNGKLRRGLWEEEDYFFTKDIIPAIQNVNWLWCCLCFINIKTADSSIYALSIQVEHTHVYGACNWNIQGKLTLVFFCVDWPLPWWREMAGGDCVKCNMSHQKETSI